MPDDPAPSVQTAPRTGQKLGPGRLVLVVGPSGAGKDTLLNGLRERLDGSSRCLFARRQITRQSDGSTEDHGTLTRQEFQELTARGEVGLAWEAHGLGYVIPEIYDSKIRQGLTVIANGSRRALPQALEKYGNVTILLITAPLEVLAARLAARGRETRAEIEKRLAQTNLDVTSTGTVIRIENTGTIAEGVNKIMAALDLA